MIMRTIWRWSNERTDNPGRLDSIFAWYALGLLTFAYALAYVDRQMLNLLVDPIRATLTITDTQFSFVQGAAFVTAYICAAPFFGRLVDISNRRNILIFGVCAWSGFTAVSGLASSFSTLFMARLGVGVSEACIVPVAISMIADSFSPRRYARALSIFYVGVQLGGGASLLASGAVIAFAGDLRRHFAILAGLETWQMAFVVVGLPGFLFALLLLTMREPSRASNPVDNSVGTRMSMADVRNKLWGSRRFYGCIYGAVGMIAVIQLGMPSWFPSFLIRAHGVSPANTGYLLGTISIFSGTLGTLTGPYLARRLEARGYSDANLRVTAFSCVLMTGFCLLIPAFSSSSATLAVATGILFSSGVTLGIISAATQIATPGAMRGVVASLYSFVSQVIGYMIGPTLIALCTDKLFADPKMIGHSMQLVMAVASAISALLLFLVLNSYRDIAGRILSAEQGGQP
jgi:MFS family permease